jgi:hypothetical protein
LFRFALSGGGRWKSTDNDIMERRPDGLTARKLPEYFVGVMLVKAYREFEDRVGITSAKRGAKWDMIRGVVSRLPNEFRYADLERACAESTTFAGRATDLIV